LSYNCKKEQQKRKKERLVILEFLLSLLTLFVFFCKKKNDKTKVSFYLVIYLQEEFLWEAEMVKIKAQDLKGKEVK